MYALEIMNWKKITALFINENKSNKPICIIIGPEGDFSEAEREEILSYEGVSSLKINENILRSETAAISTISIITYFTNL